MYNDAHLEAVFDKSDVDATGTLSYAQIATLLGDQHELLREILEGMQAARGSTATHDAGDGQVTRTLNLALTPA